MLLILVQSPMYFIKPGGTCCQLPDERLVTKDQLIDLLASPSAMIATLKMKPVRKA